MNALKNISILFLLLCIPLLLHAQSRYQRYVNAGIQALEANEFEKAVAQFEAARVTPECTLRDKEAARQWIDSTKNAQIAYVEMLRDEAIKNANRSEASRLALLSSIAYREKNYTDALQLAFHSYRLVEQDPLPSVQQAFGDAAYKIFRKIQQTDSGAVQSFYLSEAWDKIALVNREQQLSIWNATGDKTLQWKPDSGYINGLTFSKNKPLIAAYTNNGQVILWDTAGYQIKEWTAHQDDILGIQFASEQESLLSYSRDESVKLWTLDGQLIHDLKSRQGAVLQAGFSSDGQYIFSRSTEHSVTLWSESGQLLFDLNDLEGYIFDVCFAPDNTVIAIVSSAGKTYLYSTSGQLISVLSQEAMMRRAAFVQNGQKILTLGDKEVTLWDRQGYQLHQITHRQPITSFTLSPDQDILLTTAEDSTACFWSAQSLTLLQTMQHTSQVNKGLFSPNGEYCLTGTSDGVIRLWNKDGNLLMTLEENDYLMTFFGFGDQGKSIRTFDDKGNTTSCSLPSIIYQNLKNNPTLAELDMEKKKKYKLQ